MGAHANQLMVYVREMQTGANQETWQAVEALLATYVGEEADESRGDLADGFASCWRERLEVLLFKDAGVVEDTPETAVEMEEVEKVLTALRREAQKRKLQTRARQAQREDDLAMKAAMSGNGGSGGSSASTEAIPEMTPAKSQRKEVSLRRVLINFVYLNPSRVIHVSGGLLEVAVQLDVRNLEVNTTVNTGVIVNNDGSGAGAGDRSAKEKGGEDAKHEKRVSEPDVKGLYEGQSASRRRPGHGENEGSKGDCAQDKGN